MSHRGDAARWLKDVSPHFEGGQDASQNPAYIQRNCVAQAVNCTMRGGALAPRPGLLRRQLVFASNSAAKFFQRGRFQRATFYSGNGASLLSSHSGRQFRVDLKDFTVSEVTPTKPKSVATTADFVIPALGVTVAVAVADSSPLSLDLPTITIAGYAFTLASIDTTTQITVRNDMGSTVAVTAANAGGHFTVPAVGLTVAVSVDSTASLHIPQQRVRVGGKTLSLVAVNSATQITLSNDDPAQVGNVVADGQQVVVPQAGTPIGATVTHPATVGFLSFDGNDPDATLGWWGRGWIYAVYQDNQSYPIIFNGSASRRSNPSRQEIPIGNVMAYSMARFAVALPDRTSYRVGDLAGDPSGTQANNFQDAIIRFTSNNYLNEGGDMTIRVFGVPSDIGEIRSMTPTAMADTQLGQGPLMIGTENSVFTVQLPFDRTTWKNLSQPLQTVVPIKGPTGQDTTGTVNGDLWYRASDATMRSYVQATRQFYSWGNTGQSAELGELLSFDTESLLEHGSAVLFDNRRLTTVSPVMSPHGVYHRGLVSLDFDLVSNLRGKQPAAYEGVWTGLNVLQIVSGLVDGRDRCFIYALNSDQHIELWELSKTEKMEDGQPIHWNFDLGAFTCGDPSQFKKLQTGRFVIQDLVGTLNWAVKYRTDASPCYLPWDSGSACSQTEDCDTPVCAGPHNYREQARKPIKLRQPADTFGPLSGDGKARCGYEFQPRIELSGYAKIREFRLWASDEPESEGRERNES